MHRGVAKGNEIAGSQEDVVEAGQVDDDDDPSNCDIHLMAAVAPQMLQLGERARTNITREKQQMATRSGRRRCTFEDLRAVGLKVAAARLLLESLRPGGEVYNRLVVRCTADLPREEIQSKVRNQTCPAPPGGRRTVRSGHDAHRKYSEMHSRYRSGPSHRLVLQKLRLRRQA